MSIGREEDAEKLFQRLLAIRNDLGLLAEEYDTAKGRMLGNYPQAFSHVGLINSAFNLTRFHRPADQRAKADGSGVQAPGPPKAPQRPGTGPEQAEPEPAKVSAPGPFSGAR